MGEFDRMIGALEEAGLVKHGMVTVGIGGCGADLVVAPAGSEPLCVVLKTGREPTWASNVVAVDLMRQAVATTGSA